MIDLTFYGTGNLLSNNIGSIPYGVTGFFDYVSSTPGHTVPNISWNDPLFNANAQFIGEVHIPHESLINGTIGSFYFYPEVFNHPVIDQAYVSNMGLYLDPVSGQNNAAATPEAS